MVQGGCARTHKNSANPVINYWGKLVCVPLCAHVTRACAYIPTHVWRMVQGRGLNYSGHVRGTYHYAHHYARMLRACSRGIPICSRAKPRPRGNLIHGSARVDFLCVFASGVNIPYRLKVQWGVCAGALRAHNLRARIKIG